jgi:hypothetical protein
MTANESPQASYLQVLTDEQGNILAAALRTVGVASIPGEDVPPRCRCFRRKPKWCMNSRSPVLETETNFSIR